MDRFVDKWKKLSTWLNNNVHRDQEQKYLEENLLDDFAIDDEYLKIDFEKEDREIQENFWRKQNEEFEENLRLGQELVKKEYETLFDFEECKWFCVIF